MSKKFKNHITSTEYMKMFFEWEEKRAFLKNMFASISLVNLEDARLYVIDLKEVGLGCSEYKLLKYVE